MSLVAGYSSSSDDEEEGNSNNGNGRDQMEIDSVTVTAKATTGNASTITGSKFKTALFIDSDEELDDGENEDSMSNPSALRSLLPEPKKIVNASNIDEVGPIPPKKVYGDEELCPKKISNTLLKAKKSGPVKITIPSLKDVSILIFIQIF